MIANGVIPRPLLIAVWGSRVVGRYLLTQMYPSLQIEPDLEVGGILSKRDGPRIGEVLFLVYFEDKCFAWYEEVDGPQHLALGEVSEAPMRTKCRVDLRELSVRSMPDETG